MTAAERSEAVQPFNSADRETCPCPFHIWQHEVELAAVGRGASPDAVREAARAYALRWYQAGEPVWMAAESLAFVARRGAVELRADGEADSNRQMIASRSSVLRRAR
jgi:hypothetical protein